MHCRLPFVDLFTSMMFRSMKTCSVMSPASTCHRQQGLKPRQFSHYLRFSFFASSMVIPIFQLFRILLPFFSIFSSTVNLFCLLKIPTLSAFITRPWKSRFVLSSPFVALLSRPWLRLVLTCWLQNLNFFLICHHHRQLPSSLALLW